MRVLHGARAGLVLAILAAAFAAAPPFVAAPAFAADTPEDAAQKVAASWLKLIDEGKYGESWDAASGLFKAAVTREQWAQAAGSARAQVGAFGSRKLKSRQATDALPAAPPGKYVTVVYDSTFEKKSGAVETFIAVLDTDGTWRPAGYFVK